MSNSSLVSYTKISPNSSARTAPISKITIHHAAMVNVSLSTLGNAFAQPSRRASSNYGIDSDGKVGMFVEENRRAWTSSSSANDNVAVTIEVINSKGAPNWEVSDKALSTLIDLCVDICKRNGIEKLNFTGDKTGNLTQHNYFAATACPGPYLKSKFQYIADTVNKRLDIKPEQEVKPTGGETDQIYRIRTSWDKPASQTGAFKSRDNAKKACPVGYSVYDKDGKEVYTKKATSYPVDPAQSVNAAIAGDYTVTSTSLNLRCGASTNKQIIEEMPNGSIVRCYGYYTGSWLYVVSETGKIGFCHKSYLKKK